MSLRALRRLQKESLDPVVNSDEESEPETKQVKKFNPFDLLGGDDEVQQQSEEEEEEEIVYSQPVQKKSNKKKKKKKQTKQDQPQEQVDQDFSLKELDNVLEELQLNTPKESNSNNRNERIVHSLLSINPRYLDAEAEMKRLFGSHVVNSERQQSQSRVLKKSKFTTPKSEWPPYKRNGLSMELKEGHVYAFRHAEVYQDAQIEFLNAVSMHHPEALLFLTRRFPYHVDSLLQLSEIAKYSGDWTTAGDFIERALYACERALHPQFSLGQSRLSYQQSENRSFFLALFRHVQFLTRRGCWKTAFEFNKLLFSLDPTDPLCSLLSLDYHALSSRDYGYLVQLVTEWKTSGLQYPVDLADMPNMAYSVAYAQFKLKQPELADAWIKRAIQKFPFVYQGLLEKLNETPLFFRTETPSTLMDIMQQLYIERTHGLWKEPEVLDWLKRSATGIELKPQYHLCCEQGDQVPLSVCRHLVLIDIPSLMRFLPSSISDGQSIQMYDPFPPEDSETDYDLRRMAGTPAGMDGMMGILRNLLGHGADRMAPEQQQRIQQLMTELEQLRQQSAALVPGAFPQSDHDDSDDNDDDIHPLENEMHHEGLSTQEMIDIMNAIGGGDDDNNNNSDEGDLEVQRALAEEYDRQQQ